MPLLRLELSPSRGLAVLILAVHAAAAACFLTTMTAWPGTFLAVALLALGAVSAWDRALLGGAGSPRSIEIAASGEAELVLADGSRASIRALSGTGVTRHWVALAVATRMRRGMLVTAGMLERESFRRLRLWALWGRIPGAVGVVSGQLPA